MNVTHSSPGDSVGQSVRRSWTGLLLRPEVGVVVGLILVWTLFFLLAPRFLSASNVGNILTQAAELGIVAVGLAFLLIAGEFDLSVASVFVLAPLIMFRFDLYLGVPLPLAFVLGLAGAALVGWVNGAIVIRFRLPSFIVTLATALFVSGVVLAVTGGFPTDMLDRPAFMSLLSTRVGFFHTSTLWLLALVIVFQYVLNATPFGNHVYATGGDPLVTRKMGINTARVKIVNFVISAVLAGLAGCIAAARVYSVNPTVGFEFMFNAVAAAIIGGCLITGGRGSMVGTLFGVLLLTSVNSGLILAGVSPYWYRAFVGVIILLVVIANLLVVGRGRIPA